MPRIRTIKPEFFRDETLQDLESANPGCYVMLVFAGLWGHCDKNGVFEWRPRQLKLDILPFLPFNMEQALALLVDAELVRRFSADGKDYGFIPGFLKHQRVNGKESQEDSKYPSPPVSGPVTEREATGKQQGSNGEAPETTGREGKGREQEGNGVGASPPARSRASPLPSGFGISESVREWARREGFEQYLEAHLAYFLDYATAGRKVYVDWDAAFRNCVRGDWGGIRKAATSGKSVAGVDAWWSSDQGIERKAKEIGMIPKAGESWASLRDRIKQRIETSRALQ